MTSVVFQRATWTGFGVRFLAVEGAAVAVYVLFFAGALAFFPESPYASVGEAAITIAFVLFMVLFFVPLFALLPALAATAALQSWRAVRPTPAPVIGALFATAVALYWGTTLALTHANPPPYGWAPAYFVADGAVALTCAAGAALATRDAGVALLGGVAGFVTVFVPNAYLQPARAPWLEAPLLVAAIMAGLAFHWVDLRYPAKGPGNVAGAAA